MSTCKATIILGENDICKDCMKADVCIHKTNLDKKPIIEMSIEKCKYFKDRSKFIELPCKIGDYIEWKNNRGNVAILEIKGFEFGKQGNAQKYLTKYSDIQPFVDSEDIISVIAKEEAEQALMEMSSK